MKKAFDWPSHAALLLAALIYGGNYSVAKLVLDPGYLHPLAFIVLRVCGAGLLFWFFHTLFIRERMQRADLAWVALCSAFGVAINMSFFFMGLKQTTPINASLIMTTVPIFVLISSALYLGERITLRKMAGIGIGASGAVLLIAYQHRVSFEYEQMMGNVLVLVNAMSYSLYLVLVKRLMRRYQPMTVITWVFTLGLPLVLPFGLPPLGETVWPALDLPIWLAIAYVIVGTTFLTYLCNAFALSRVRASTVSIYIYLQPLFAAIIALGLGQEALTANKIVAAVLIFTGVSLVSR